MEQKLLIRIGIVLVIGIIVIIIGFALWHGGSGTCMVPPTNTGFNT